MGLKLCDFPADRSNRDAQRPRGSRETSRLDDGDENAHCTQAIHLLFQYWR
jgi:hypothetical protein